MHRTTIFLPEELERQLDAVARRMNRPRAELVRDALTLYLRGLEPGRPRSIGMGASRDAAAGSEDVKRWAREHWDRRADAR